MAKERIQLSDELSIEMYPFSDYITCVEVFFNGESFNAFCSDTDVVEEWKESPQTLVELCQRHMLQQPSKQGSPNSKSNNRQKINDTYEFESYSFSEDVYCINVFKDGRLYTSFCSDQSSLEEWQDDPQDILSVITNIKKTW